MKKNLLLSLLAFLIASSAQATTHNNNISNSLSHMLNKAMPAVVNISVRGQLPPMQAPIIQSDQNGSPALNHHTIIAPKFEGIGSGVIVDAERGIILTNAHILKNVRIIMVTLSDGRRIQAKILGFDPKSDIAIIQINAKYLTAIPFGDSDYVKVGEAIAAIGNPFGLNQTVTSGVVSALGRGDLGIEGYENFIQIDAPINLGNSGGALVNMEGELIGINTAIITPYSAGGNVGIGLAIPSNMCKSIMEQIIRYGKVEHGFLGVLVQNITPPLATAMNLPDNKGALISQVAPHSPAEKIGLQPRDIILEINHKSIISAYQVNTIIGLLRPGTDLTLKIRSNNKIKILSAIVSSIRTQQEIVAKEEKPLLSGLALMDVNQLTNNHVIAGVMVLDVDDFTVAHSCGLHPGDVIVAANNQPITKIEQLQKIATEHPNALLLNVKRSNGISLFLVLEK